MFTVGARCHDYGKGTPGAVFARVHADGFGCIQLAPKKAVAGIETIEDITLAKLEEIRAALAENELSAAVYGCYIEPSLVDEAGRRNSVAEFTRSIPLAKALSARCIGTETTAMSGQPGVSREEALCALRRSLGEILPVAQAHGVLVAIEPVATHTMNTPECTKEILDSMASPNLGVIFDPVNLLTPEELPRQRALWERCFTCFGDRIAAVHMKGAALSGGRIVEAPFEESAVDYAWLFGALRALGKDLPILREEVDPAHGREDALFLQKYF